MSKREKIDIEDKYPPMSPEDIENEVQAVERGKAKLSMEYADVEEALTEYLETPEPIINPANGKAIMWIRRPSIKELKGLIPAEMRKYTDNDKEVPESVSTKYEEFFYRKLAEMVVVPKYTAEQWKAKANPWLLKLFWTYIANISKFMEGKIEGF
jgi:hypothetical protein